MGRVLITGVGCVTPIGTGVQEFATGLRDGVSGVRSLTQCDPAPYKCRVAAEIRQFEPLNFMDLREAKSLPRVAQFAVAAGRLAIEHAKLDHSGRQERIGILIGTSSGPLAYALEQHAIFLERGARRTDPSSPAFAHNSVIASECAIQFGLRGPALTVSSACTSAADAMGVARLMIEAGLADIMLVGGAEAPLTPSLFAAFDRLGILPTRSNDRPEAAACPFDVRRDGPALGEGAVVFVFESEASAHARGVRPLAEMAGYGGTCDAASHFSQEQTGVDAVRAVEDALASAGVSPRDLDYVNAHCTGTPENDPFETRVLQRVLGADVDRVPVSSSKSQFGHLLGGAAAIEAAAVLVAMEGSFLP